MKAGGQRHTLAALALGKGPLTHCQGDYIGPTAGLDGCGKSHPTGTRSPGRPGPSKSLYRLRYPGTPFSRPKFILMIHKVAVRTLNEVQSDCIRKIN